MSSEDATMAAVSALFVAAGRNATDVEFELYHAVLDDVTDAELGEAVATIVRGVDLGQRFPSPALIRETVTAVRRHRRQTQPALPEDTGPILSPEENVKALRAIRSAIRRSDGSRVTGNEAQR